MSNEPVSDGACSAKLGRIAGEDAYGDRLRGWITKSGAKFVDVARSLGIRREDLYEVLDGAKHMRAAWVDCLPPAVELLSLAERARHHGYELAPVGDGASAGARLHTLIVEMSDVMRVASASESDGDVNVTDAIEEREEIAQLRKALADRDAHLVEVIKQRGMRVVGGR